MRTAFVALILMTAPAAAETLTMSATSTASRIDVTLTNTSRDVITLGHVSSGGVVEYPGLHVSLAGAASRTLQFTNPRISKLRTLEDDVIAAGKSVVKSIDLQTYALHYDKGGPIAPGDYDATITWDTRALDCNRPCGGLTVLTASAKLTIAAPIEKPCTESPPSLTGLQMLARIDGKRLEVGIHNIDTRTHCIAAYIKTFETQSDWLTLELDNTHTMKFRRSRDKSVVVRVELAPGATSWTRWDLPAWAKLDGVPLAGPHQSRLTYDATRERDLWNGKLETSDAWLP